MSTQSLSSQEAAELFVKRLIEGSYEATIEALVGLLKDGPPGRKKPPDDTDLHYWYLTLDSKEQQHVLAVVHKAVSLAIFGCLVLLDNKQGGYPVPDKLSDFAIYIQTYTNGETKVANIPESSVRLNMSYRPDGDLHDLFQFLLEERTTRKFE